MAGNNRLETKLRAIQQLKRDYYIGTQEAKDYLEAVAGVYENPKQSARLINDNLAQSGPVTYLATPERLAGLDELIINLTEKINFSDEMQVNREDMNEKKGCPDDYLSGEFESFKFLEVGKKAFTNPKETAEIFLPIFEYANHRGCSSNEEFKAMVVAFIATEYNKVKNKIDESRLLMHSREYLGRLASNLLSCNFDAALSKEVYQEIENGALEDCKHLLKTVSMVDRITRDQVTYKLEYRRGILNTWLDKKMDRYGSIKTWRDAISIVERQMQMRKGRLEHFRKMDMPEDVVEEEEKMIRESEFIRDVLERDKSFVINFLAN